MRFAAEMHSKWENPHVWRNSHFSQDDDHNKQKGEWIHLVLLGMANRCQMGINGPPNVLLQKAFFSAQYFADILSNICIISLRKYFWMEKYIICRMTSLWWSLWRPPNHKKKKTAEGKYSRSIELVRGTLAGISNQQMRLTTCSTRPQVRAERNSKFCRRNLSTFSPLLSLLGSPGDWDSLALKFPLSPYHLRAWLEFFPLNNIWCGEA